MSPIRAGELKHQVTIQKNTTADNSKGVRTNVWATRFTWRCKATVLSGEKAGDDIAQGVTVTEFFGRYMAGVLYEDRISHLSSIYEITSIVPSADKSEMTITGRVIS